MPTTKTHTPPMHNIQNLQFSFPSLPQHLF